MATAQWTSAQVRSPNGELGIIGLIGREPFPACQPGAELLFEDCKNVSREKGFIRRVKGPIL